MLTVVGCIIVILYDFSGEGGNPLFFNLQYDFHPLYPVIDIEYLFILVIKEFRLTDSS